MAEHTPGPWTAAAFSSVVGCPIVAQPDKTKNSIVVAGAHGAAAETREGVRAEVEANARLIAAAPDLLKAAKRALAVLKAQGESVRAGAVTGALAAAIAKAEGKPFPDLRTGGGR